MSEEYTFLSWLGGYFDHGGCCKTYHRTQRIRGRLYSALDVHVVISGTKEIIEYIKAHYSRWNAKISRNPRSRSSWRFKIRNRTEMLLFCRDLLPYTKFRANDLRSAIETIIKEGR